MSEQSDWDRQNRETAFMRSMAMGGPGGDVDPDALAEEVARRMALIGEVSPDQDSAASWVAGDAAPPTAAAEAAVRSAVGGWCSDIPFIYEETHNLLVRITIATASAVTSPPASGLVRRPGYGWRLAKDGVSLEPDEDEQQVISTVWECRRKKMAINPIWHVLQRRGMRNRRGLPFLFNQVRALTQLVPVEELRKLN